MKWNANRPLQAADRFDGAFLQCWLPQNLLGPA
jgi:hypothetical protein